MTGREVTRVAEPENPARLLTPVAPQRPPYSVRERVEQHCVDIGRASSWSAEPSGLAWVTRAMYRAAGARAARIGALSWALLVSATRR
jgi:hypothetical protein